ncbi:MAG: rhomboid family intramembrane serine protease [Actinomycetaceae bacterium]|nr:rhomboid family intramembrane serine protease [Actinomycetaceae bacterium]
MGVTDAIIGICLVMLIADIVIPPLGWMLSFFPPFAASEPYRFITSAFLHRGFWHFAFNMITLYLVGIQLERGLGRIRYGALYLISAFAGNVGVLAWAATLGSWNVSVVGASGAVFGLFGALLAFAGVGSDNFRSILVLVLINLAYGFISPGISWQSHVAGFIGGFALAWAWNVIGMQVYKRGRVRNHSHAYLAVLDAGVALGLTLALAVLAYFLSHTFIRL